MPERERLTKRERRERARAERRAEEAAAAKRARFERIRNVGVTVAVIAGVAALLFFTRESPAPAVELTASEIEEAQEAAGCEPIQVPDLGAGHLDLATAPPADQMYPVRPPASGPHLGSPLAPTGFNDDPIDERSAVHNLEHGAVAVWFDPARVDDAGEIERWVDERNAAGFASGARGGGALMAAPFPAGLTSGKSIALRAWNVAVDCASFDTTVADGFVATNFGTRGEASEGSIAGYPEGAIRITDAPSGSPSPHGGPSGSPAPTG